jgi:hypothetical protein
MRPRHWLTALVAVTGVLGAVLGGVPAGVAPVRAAGYRLSTEATYVVHPARREVAVKVQVDFRNTTPNPSGRFSVFDVIDLAIHSGAREVRASDRRGRLKVKVDRRQGLTVASVSPRRGVRFGDEAHFTLRYTLPDGASHDVRIRESVITFPVWSFGTQGRASVTLPVDYKVLVDGDSLNAVRAGESWRLTSGLITDPAHWLALLTASLPSTFVSLPGSVALANGPLELEVRSWSDDRRWARQTRDLAVKALPRLEKAAGVELPVSGPLVIVESLPAAGGELSEPVPSGADMAIGFDDPPFTILHQLAHTWFTPQLASERWIREGLASSAAARVARQLKVPAPFDPIREAAKLNDDAFPLVSWGVGEASARQDRYAYAASWAAIEEIRSAVGDDVLRTALRRFAAGLDGYQPLNVEPVPGQRLSAPFDSRHLYDQLDALSDVPLRRLFERWVFDDRTSALLPARAAARADAEALARSAGGWGLPDAVRLALAGWRFDDARSAIGEARAWLADRDSLIADARAAGLTVPQRLEDEYRTGGGSSAARAELDLERSVVTAYVAASRTVTQPRSPVEQVGLLGAPDPAATLAEARAAFSAGDVVGASGLASDALDRLRDAGRDGLVRLVSAAVVLLAALGGLVWLVRRRRQRPIPGYTAGP